MVVTMEDSVPIPGVFQFGVHDIATDWRRWRRAFENWMVATEKPKKSQAVQVAILLSFLGIEGQDIFDTFDWEVDEGRDLQTVLRKFDAYCEPRQNVTMARFKFFGLMQGELRFIDFVVQLQSLANRCNFGDLRDSLIRDMIIHHCASDELRRKLLIENDPDLSMVKTIALAEEESIQHERAIKGCMPPGNSNASAVRAQTKFVRFDNAAGLCTSCGLGHGKSRSCPATDQDCYKCGISGHFARMCDRGPSRPLVPRTDERHVAAGVSAIVDSGSEDGEGQIEEVEQLLQVREAGNRLRGWYQFLDFGGQKVEFLVDTAADSSVLSEETAMAISEKI
jgi:hypothetical protein